MTFFRLDVYPEIVKCSVRRDSFRRQQSSQRKEAQDASGVEHSVRKYAREFGACYATEALQKAEVEADIVASHYDLVASLELSPVMLGYEVQQKRERLSRRYGLAGMRNQINAIYL